MKEILEDIVQAVSPVSTPPEKLSRLVSSLDDTIMQSNQCIAQAFEYPTQDEELLSEGAELCSISSILSQKFVKLGSGDIIFSEFKREVRSIASKLGIKVKEATNTTSGRGRMPSPRVPERKQSNQGEQRSKPDLDLDDFNMMGKGDDQGLMAHDDGEDDELRLKKMDDFDQDFDEIGKKPSKQKKGRRRGGFEDEDSEEEEEEEDEFGAGGGFGAFEDEEDFGEEEKEEDIEKEEREDFGGFEGIPEEDEDIEEGYSSGRGYSSRDKNTKKSLNGKKKDKYYEEEEEVVEQVDDIKLVAENRKALNKNKAIMDDFFDNADDSLPQHSSGLLAGNSVFAMARNRVKKKEDDLNFEDEEDKGIENKHSERSLSRKSSKRRSHNSSSHRQSPKKDDHSIRKPKRHSPENKVQMSKFTRTVEIKEKYQIEERSKGSLGKEVFNQYEAKVHSEREQSDPFSEFKTKNEQLQLGQSQATNTNFDDYPEFDEEQKEKEKEYNTNRKFNMTERSEDDSENYFENATGGLLEDAYEDIYDEPDYDEVKRELEEMERERQQNNKQLKQQQQHTKKEMVQTQPETQDAFAAFQFEDEIKTPQDKGEVSLRNHHQPTPSIQDPITTINQYPPQKTQPSHQFNKELTFNESENTVRHSRNDNQPLNQIQGAENTITSFAENLARIHPSNTQQQQLPTVNSHYTTQMDPQTETKILKEMKKKLALSDAEREIAVQEKQKIQERYEDLMNNQVKKLKEELQISKHSSKKLELEKLKNDIFQLGREKTLYKSKYEDLFKKVKTHEINEREDPNKIITAQKILNLTIENDRIKKQNLDLTVNLKEERAKSRIVDQIMGQLNQTQVELDALKAAQGDENTQAFNMGQILPSNILGNYGNPMPVFGKAESPLSTANGRMSGYLGQDSLYRGGEAYQRGISPQQMQGEVYKRSYGAPNGARQEIISSNGFDGDFIEGQEGYMGHINIDPIDGGSQIMMKEDLSMDTSGIDFLKDFNSELESVLSRFSQIDTAPAKEYKTERRRERPITEIGITNRRIQSHVTREGYLPSRFEEQRRNMGIGESALSKFQESGLGRRVPIISYGKPDYETPPTRYVRGRSPSSRAGLSGSEGNAQRTSPSNMKDSDLFGPFGKLYSDIPRPGMQASNHVEILSRSGRSKTHENRHLNEKITDFKPNFDYLNIKNHFIEDFEGLLKYKGVSIFSAGSLYINEDININIEMTCAPQKGGFEFNIILKFLAKYPFSFLSQTSYKKGKFTILKRLEVIFISSLPINYAQKR